MLDETENTPCTCDSTLRGRTSEMGCCASGDLPARPVSRCCMGDVPMMAELKFTARRIVR